MWVPSWNPTKVVPNGTIRTGSVSEHTHLVWRKYKEAEVLIMYHMFLYLNRTEVSTQQTESP